MSRDEFGDLPGKSGYVRIRFYSPTRGATAGLVIEASKFSLMSTSALSRLFPKSECLKMGRIQRSPAYETWSEAFAHRFQGEEVMA